jgi:hypothetical protein
MTRIVFKTNVTATAAETGADRRVLSLMAALTLYRSQRVIGGMTSGVRFKQITFEAYNESFRSLSGRLREPLIHGLNRQKCSR